MCVRGSLAGKLLTIRLALTTAKDITAEHVEDANECREGPF
jgi:hypothetical protein